MFSPFCDDVDRRLELLCKVMPRRLKLGMANEVNYLRDKLVGIENKCR